MKKWFSRLGKWFAGAVIAGLAANAIIGAEINDLNVTDASNTARFPEGLLAGSTNDNLRALEGLLARGFKDTVDGVLSSTGSNTALNITSNRTGTSSIYTGLSARFIAHTTLGDAPTLTFNSVSAVRIAWPNGTPLSAGVIAQNDVVEVVLSDHKWRAMSIGVAPLQRAFTEFQQESPLSRRTIPRDETIPQNTEGDQIMEVSITPAAGNNIKVSAVVQFGSLDSIGAVQMTCALFQDSTANALAVAHADISTDEAGVLMFMKEVSALTNTSKTFKVRCGDALALGGAAINSAGNIAVAPTPAVTSLYAEEVAP